MIIQHNMRAMNANRQLNVISSEQSKSTEKLSSGYRINRAADDAAGLSISEKMRAQIRGLTQASRNAQDGVSMVQTAEGALNEVTSMLQRMNELAVQASTGTVNSVQKGYLNDEVNALKEEINRIGTDTKFNGTELFKSSKASYDFFVGAENSTSAVISAKSFVLGCGDVADKDPADGTYTIKTGENGGLKIGEVAKLDGDEYKSQKMTAMDKEGKATYASAAEAADGTHIGTATSAKMFIDNVQKDLETISSYRSDFGAVQNRLEYTIKNLDNVTENTQAAESRVRDTNMATEMVKYSNNNILAQAGQSMLAQANQANVGVLGLLQ